MSWNVDKNTHYLFISVEKSTIVSLSLKMVGGNQILNIIGKFNFTIKSKRIKYPENYDEERTTLQGNESLRKAARSRKDIIVL